MQTPSGAGNVSNYVTIGLRSVSHWSRRRSEFCGPITERRKKHPAQTISIGEGEEELLGLPQFPHSQFHPLLFLTDNVTVFFAARRNFTRINHR